MRARSRSSSDASVSPGATGSVSRARPGPRPSLPEVQGRTSRVTTWSLTDDGSWPRSGPLRATWLEGADEFGQAEPLQRLRAGSAGLGLPAHALPVGADHPVPVRHDA